ncbi:MAG: histidine phosphatase family protein [Chlorobi bacterium]|nr:histidine phosphatase family protein [Chlorobiota bacterium]
MRHGKSDWGSGSLRDFDRPLNERGKRDVVKIGKEIKNRSLTPDLIISSPAERAKKTAEGVAEFSGYGKDIEWKESFYFGYYKEILETLNNIDDNAGIVMIVGHNPTWSSLTERLSGKYFDMKTANVCILEFEGSWNELSENYCKFITYISPKKL